MTKLTLIHNTDANPLPNRILSEPMTIFDERAYTESEHNDGIVSEDVEDLTRNIVALIERTAKNLYKQVSLIGVKSTANGKQFDRVTQDELDLTALRCEGSTLYVELDRMGSFEIILEHIHGVNRYGLNIEGDSAYYVKVDDEFLNLCGLID
ncbi:hypothetical protein [Aerococcus viridans]|uniref:hypothetical protein n=1 Tax=Aerococcus viridans TaxID=1377 RepID=UPI002DB88013|nr:hypothetical protein [Aerococcus viridans]MEC1386520.1 hypothetical protein [Aerococcus viridans]